MSCLCKHVRLFFFLRRFIEKETDTVGEWGIVVLSTGPQAAVCFYTDIPEEPNAKAEP